MGWQNPPMPWQELERRLSGRAEPDDRDELVGDGGDSPAWSRKRTAYIPAWDARPIDGGAPPVRYAELHAHSSFSFLDGASSPEEMVEEAVRLGLSALTLTDHDGFYGIVRFSEAADTLGLPTVIGAELCMDVPMPTTQSERMVAARVGKPDPTGHHLLVLARDPTGYASLARAISTAQQRGGVKGRPVYDGDELAELANGHWLVLTGCRKGLVRAALASGLDSARRALANLIDRFGRDNVVVELTYALDPLADERYDALTLLAEEAGLPVVATTAAHYHGPPRRPLATAMAAVRARSNLDEMDGWLPAFADQHLRSGAEMAARFARWPGVVERAASLGDQLAFPLRLIAPQLPPFPVPPGHTEMTYLAELARAGAVERYGDRKPEERERAFAQIEHELAIIDELGVPGLLPRRLGHRAVLPLAGNPLPRQGICRQLSSLLRTANHRRGRSPLRIALRTVPLPGPGRAT